VKISAVIPVYNEAESLELLYGEIQAVGQEHGYEWDIIFVDDGSTDDSWRKIEQLAKADSRVQGIRLRRNFGKAAALSAGFDVAQGEIVFTLDADLQDDPREIPHFLEVLETGVDVVSGWKKVRHDPWHKVGPSRVFNAMVSTLTGVRLHDHNCGFKCYRREIFAEIDLYGELHRFIPVLAAARGWRVGEVVVQHRAREFGHSKYGVGRIIKGFLDLLTVYFLTGFRQRPQHLLGAAGLICFLGGGALVAGLTAWRVVSHLTSALEPLHLHERAIFYYSLTLLLLGGQLLTAGFLAELMTAHRAREQRSYSIMQHAGGGAASNQKQERGDAN